MSVDIPFDLFVTTSYKINFTVYIRRGTSPSKQSEFGWSQLGFQSQIHNLSHGDDSLFFQGFPNDLDTYRRMLENLRIIYTHRRGEYELEDNEGEVSIQKS